MMNSHFVLIIRKGLLICVKSFFLAVIHHTAILTVQMLTDDETHIGYLKTFTLIQLINI